ncbi:MAG: glutamate racemase [Candidatus Coproplasma sp.]
MEIKKRNVVVFDSGIGGLNLLYECALRVRWVDYYYVSDSEHMPYGNRSREEILTLTLNALKAAEKLNPAALVLACNTVTANCIDVLRARYAFPVIGVQPAIKSVSALCDNCLILATNATVNSEEFKKLLYKYNKVNVNVKGCDGLAKYVEENIFNFPDTIPQGLLPDVKVDCVVLGCTHYSFISSQISAYYACPVMDGIGATADHFAKILGIDDHLTPLLGKNRHFSSKTVNITFLGADNEKNSQIFRTIIKNKRLNMSDNFIKIKKY